MPSPGGDNPTNPKLESMTRGQSGQAGQVAEPHSFIEVDDGQALESERLLGEQRCRGGGGSRCSSPPGSAKGGEQEAPAGADAEHRICR